MSKILIVDDDNELANAVRQLLSDSGYIVDIANSAEEAEPMLSFAYDMYILDWMMPGKSGVDVLEKLRKGSCKAPILMLTGMDSIDHKSIGFESGADDYLTKPFNSRELLMRVRALLRRPATFEGDELKCADVLLNLRTAQVTWRGQDIRLTKQELQLLEFLMRHKNQVMSHETLVERAWSSLSESSPDTVRMHMSRLRKKFAGGEKNCPIETVHGQGYVFRAAD